jgi:predicted Ser/Thr protein kinase
MAENRNPAVPDSKGDGHSRGSRFNIQFRKEIESDSEQVVSLKTDNKVKRVELAVILPGGKKKLFHEKVKSGRCVISFIPRTVGEAHGSLAAFGKREMVYLDDFTFLIKAPDGSSGTGNATTPEKSEVTVLPVRRNIKLPDGFRNEIIKSWPNSSAYSQSLQNLSFSISEKYQEIRSGSLVRNQNVKFVSYILGSGNFGTVFKINTNSRDYALKCFTRAAPDLAERYYLISEYLSGISLSFLVGFRYLSSAIRMINKPTTYYPILQMDWVDGASLNSFIMSHLNEGKYLKTVADEFLNAIIVLRNNGIAHGDISSDNIIIDSSGKVRLIDYDGMYVPPFSGRIAPEKGHEHFQHPLRGDHYGENLDNFSVLVVYLSLYALSRDPSLWKYNGYDGDKIILDVKDFMEPSKSALIEELEGIGGKTRKLTDLLVQACGKDPLWDGTDPSRIRILR